MSTENKKMQLSFLHVSDVHLDIPFTGLTAEKSEERRRALRTSFMNLMKYVRSNGINVVLISGDLFNTEYATNTTAEVLIREFCSCPNTDFIIAPGKHDSYNANPIYTSGRLPENCHVFSSDKLSRFDFADYNVTVYGWAFMDGSLRENPLVDRHVDDASRVNIVCAYADLDGSTDSDCCPISTSDIKRFGADYYALGSRHEATDFLAAGASKYAYAGSLECTGFDEPGLGAANRIIVTYSDGELSIECKKLTEEKVRFATERIDITGVDSSNEIVHRISDLVSTRGYNSSTALRVELTGYVDPRFNAQVATEASSYGLYYFDLKDKTIPIYGTEGLKRDMSVKGQIFRSLYDDLVCDDEEKRLVAARALRVALAALEGRDLP